MCEHQDNKVVVHSSQFIKITGIFVLDNQVYQKFRSDYYSEISINFNVFNPSNCFTGLYLKPSQHVR